MKITGGPSDPSFKFEVLPGDQDGDSIDNFREFLIGYNPCSKKSFGCVNDADLDFDKDGMIRVEYQVDCV